MRLSETIFYEIQIALLKEELQLYKKLAFAYSLNKAHLIDAAKEAIDQFEIRKK